MWTMINFCLFGALFAPPSQGSALAETLPDAKTSAVARLALTKAPSFPGRIEVTANRSSVMLYLPLVPGAKDYRVFSAEHGVVSKIVGDTEDIIGASITCAGLRQRNDCDDTEAVKAYGDAEIIMAAHCRDDVRSINWPKTVARRVEVNGLVGPSDLIIEAIDRLCPFVGALGKTHAEVRIAGAQTPLTTTFAGRLLTFPVFRPTFPIRTELEVRSDFGSLIINGHGPAPRPADLRQGPYLNVAQPAPRDPPLVLNRTFIRASPLGTSRRPVGYKDSDIFDDFSDSSDHFVLQAKRKHIEGVILPAGLGNVTGAVHFANSNWNHYAFNYDVSQVYIDRGQLNMLIADSGQDVMASNVIYPKRVLQIPSTRDAFLHITFETQGNATQRRYWWLHLCGSDRPGQTYAGTTFTGTSTVLAAPFFMDPASGGPISMAGWNCLQFIPRAGSFEVLPGGERQNTALGGSRSQGSMRILVNRPTPAGQEARKDTNSVQLLDPAQVPGDQQQVNGQWLRSWDDLHRVNGSIFDDELYVAQRTKFDIYVNRSRIVMFINGKQKICDNLKKSQISMAEAAVGLGQVFYHSSAERTELMGPMWVKTGQHYYLHNTPFVDVRSFDNIGMRESVALPPSFKPGPCYDAP